MYYHGPQACTEQVNLDIWIGRCHNDGQRYRVLPADVARAAS